MKGGPSGWVRVLPPPHQGPSDPPVTQKTQEVQKTKKSILKIPVLKPPESEDNPKTRRQRKTEKNETVQKTKITSMFSSIVSAKNSTVEREDNNIDTVCEDTLHCPGSNNILHCPDSENARAKNTDDTERDGGRSRGDNTCVQSSEMKSESLTPEVIELSLIRDYNTKPDLAQHYNNRKKISLSGLVSESLDQYLPDRVMAVII